MLEKLTLQDFSKYLNQTFTVHRDSSCTELLLIRADGLGAPSKDENLRQPFSLIFRGPAGENLPQSIYRLEHPVMGILDIFLVPVGPDSEGQCYEAVFS